MSRRKTWSPPRSVHANSPISSLGDKAAQVDTAEAWSSDPRSHVAAHKPNCNKPGCRAPAMAWWRCRCGARFSRCPEHHFDEPIAKLREAHRCPEVP